MIFREFNTQEDLFSAACAVCEAASREVINQGRRFYMILPGGSTVVPLLDFLVKSEIEWDNVTIFLSDERCVHEESEDRNCKVIEERFIAKLKDKKPTFHKIPVELGGQLASEKYSSILTKLEVIDLAILGIGEDGHTASLFPDQEIEKNLDAVWIQNSPKPPLDRVSLTYSALARVNQIFFIATGYQKIKIIERLKLGHKLPVSLIQGRSESKVYYIN